MTHKFASLSLSHTRARALRWEEVEAAGVIFGNNSRGECFRKAVVVVGVRALESPAYQNDVPTDAGRRVSTRIRAPFRAQPRMRATAVTRQLYARVLLLAHLPPSIDGPPDF